MLEKLLKAEELASLLGIKKNTLYHWVSSGFIPYLKVGGGVRFNQSEVLQWLEKRRKKGRATRIPNIELTNIIN